MHRFTHPLAAAVISLAAVPALATTSTYTSSASFLPLLAPGAYTEAFTRADFDFAASFSFSGNGFAYTVAAAPGSTYLSGSFVGNLSANQPLKVTFTSGNVMAVGGEFFITDVLDDFVAAPVTVTLADGTTTTFTPGSQAGAYRGFISDIAITSLTLSAPGTGNFNSIDNLTVGTVAAAVPEPGTWLMLALGGGLVLLGRRRRQA